MIDRESVGAVTSWLRLADRVAGVKPIEGRCDQCGRAGYLSYADDQRLCAACYLDGVAIPS